MATRPRTQAFHGARTKPKNAGTHRLHDDHRQTAAQLIATTSENPMSKQVQDAYIVAAVRTPVGKAPRGVFRNTRPDDMLAFAIDAALSKFPQVDKSRIDDAVIGCA